LNEAIGGGGFMFIFYDFHRQIRELKPQKEAFYQRMNKIIQRRRHRRWIKNKGNKGRKRFKSYSSWRKARSTIFWISENNFLQSNNIIVMEMEMNI